MITTFLLLTFLASGTEIEGQVRDARTHNVIPFASVELFRDNFPVNKQITDRDGRFRFEDSARGVYSVSVAHEDYDPIVLDVNWERAEGGVIQIELRRLPRPKTHTDSVLSARQFTIPKDARREFARGYKETERHNWSKAMPHLEAGLRLYANDSTALNSLGNCYQNLGQMQNAEAAFKRALAVSDSVYIALNLADVLTSQKRFDEAESFLSGVIRKSPQNGDAYFGLAAAYFKAGRLHDSEVTAVQAERYAHRIPDVHLLLAKIYAQQQRDNMVTDELRMYLKEAPNSPERKQMKRHLEESNRREACSGGILKSNERKP